jgi:hypothetical protein
MANYVERDGDWVWRPTGKLKHVTMYIFVLRGGGPELTALCDKFINNPSGGAVDAKPLIPLVPLVLLTCVDIKHGNSAHPGDINRGYMTERDMGFFVPISFTDQNGAVSRANLLPYLFVDNFPAVLIGREIYGFPKILGDIRFEEHPPYFDLVSSAIPNYGVDEIVVQRPIVVIRNTFSGAPTVLPGGNIMAQTAALMALLTPLLGLPPALNVGFTDISMVFLKQFRDAANAALACHQSIVKADSHIDAIRTLRFHLNDTFDINIRRLNSISIADTLGLGAGTVYHPLATISVELDFSLPPGSSEWTAP